MFYLNYKKGLYRIWIVASFVWIVFYGILLSDNIQEEYFWMNNKDKIVSSPECSEDLAKETLQLCLLESKKQSVEKYRNNLIKDVSIIFLPPIMVLLLAFVVRWIASGFIINSKRDK